MKIKNINMITLCAVCIIALVVGMAAPVSAVSDEKFLSDARQSYRSASLVVSGICKDTLTAADGCIVSRVFVDEVLAGNAKQGDLLRIRDDLVPGSEYLLYLGYGEEVHFAEDQYGYDTVSSEPFVISGDTVEYRGSSMSLEDIKQDMAAMDRIVTVHGAMYYHGSLEALKKGSESIFIGNVASISSFKNTRFRSQEGGSTIEKTAPAATVTINVYGSVKGAVSFGSAVDMMYIPESVGIMTDSASLEPASHAEDDIMELEEGGTYLFFLRDDPDAKQTCAFPVNPIQGWIKVENDILTYSPANGALAGYKTLPQLVSAINNIE